MHNKKRILIIEKLIGFWQSYYDTLKNDEHESPHLENSPFIGYLEMSDLTIVDLNIETNIINYVSDNIEKNYFIDKDELIKQGMYYYSKTLIPEHLEYIKIISDLRYQAFATCSLSELMNMRISTIGVRMITPDRGSIALLINTTFSQFNESNIPTRMLMMMQNITHLMKDEHYWIRFYNSENPSKSLFYHSNPDFKSTGNLLSKREMEILKLMVKCKTPDEIAKELFISRITINNHRQKILDKFCVKDTTALITLSILTGYHLSDEINS